MEGTHDQPAPSRRAVLRGAGAAVVAAGLGACTSEGRSSAPDPAVDDAAGRRVLVVGAGLAGLTCALDLIEAGWEVTVLEARDRVGGRVHTVRGEAFTGGLHAEAGGESIDADHQDLLALLARFDLRTEGRPPNKVVEGTTRWRGTTQRTDAFIAGDDGRIAADYGRFYDELAALAEGLDPEHPDRGERSAELDARSIADLTDDLDLHPAARFLVDSESRGEFNADPSQVSLLFAAQQAAITAQVADDGIEAMRVRGGNDLLPQAMAEALGDRVVLRAPVTRVRHRRDRVTVVAGGREHVGAWLVVACPFEPLRRVAFEPELPVAVRSAIDGLDLGDAAKVTVEYRRAFWEDDGSSGFTVTDLPFGIAWSPTDSLDRTDPESPSTDHALLTAFITGPAAVDAAGQRDAERIAAVREQFAEVYPEADDLDAGHQATIAWANERYTGGGYAVFRPGQLASFWPTIRSGTGRIRFAGEHTEALAGYMESAVRSGHRVARELGDPPPPRRTS